MRPFGDRVPRLAAAGGRLRARPARSLVAALAPLLAAIPAAIAGLERTSPAIVLLAAVLTAAGIVAVVVRDRAAHAAGERRAARPAARPTTPGGRCCWRCSARPSRSASSPPLWAVLGDLRGSLDVPPELDTRSLTAQLYDLPLREPSRSGPA